MTRHHHQHLEKKLSHASSMSSMTVVTDFSDKEKEFAESSGFESLEKNIDSFSSFCLISNNISGPAMMGLPHVFKSAGIVPTVVAIVIAYITSSLTGTLLADAVASVPGNGRYHRNLDFSKAFKIVVGKRWASFAEFLFILACMSQACSALVETAQSLDGFLASFLLGKTYAFQLYPWPEFIEWSPANCGNKLGQNTGTACEPFATAGPVIVTFGYLLTTFMFLPFGTGNMQEAMIMQIISFVFFCFLLLVFYWEFASKGLNIQVPWVGEDVWEVPGVIIFNFAFSITVPSWLNEKHPAVSVNKVIWGSSTITSVIYVTFGMFAAMAFQHCGEDILVLLSSEQVHVVTRFCAATFGVAIIGCGVPIFCIMIKNSLYLSGACNIWWAYFGGALLPYILSLFMYQGKTLLVVLDWTGIIVNGLVAFVLPLVLATRALDRMMRDFKRRAKLAQLEKLGFIDLSETAVDAVLAQFGIVPAAAAGGVASSYIAATLSAPQQDHEQIAPSPAYYTLTEEVGNSNSKRSGGGGGEGEGRGRRAGAEPAEESSSSTTAVLKSKQGGSRDYGTILTTDNDAANHTATVTEEAAEGPLQITLPPVPQQPTHNPAASTPISKTTSAAAATSPTRGTLFASGATSALKSAILFPHNVYIALGGGGGKSSPSSPKHHHHHHHHHKYHAVVHHGGGSSNTNNDDIEGFISVDSPPSSLGGGGGGANGEGAAAATTATTGGGYSMLTQANVSSHSSLATAAAGSAAATHEGGRLMSTERAASSLSTSAFTDSTRNDGDVNYTVDSSNKSKPGAANFNSTNHDYTSKKKKKEEEEEKKRGDKQKEEEDVGDDDPFNDFDSYSEEDDAEERYDIEAEDEDALVLDDVNVDVQGLLLVANTPAPAAVPRNKTTVALSRDDGKQIALSSLLLPPSRLSYSARTYQLTSTTATTAADHPSSSSSSSRRISTTGIAGDATATAINRQEALQRFAVFAHRKLPFNYNVVRPLPASLEPYRRHFLIAATWFFSIVIVVTMTEKIYVGCLAPDL